MFDKYEFALCLTHDVDIIYKTYQSLYHGLKNQSIYHFSTLRSWFSADNPYWQFEEIMNIEEELGVRSAFYFLNEKNLFRNKGWQHLARPKSWLLFTDRYDIDDPTLVKRIRMLEEGGWEIGLHGSYDSYKEPDRLAYEFNVLSDLIEGEVVGNRQHHLNLNRPETWRTHVNVGLRYDASLGSPTDYGFDFGYDIHRPFNDDFVVFPLTVMDTTLLQNCESVESAKDEADDLLNEAAENNAIMTLDWHQRIFNEREFPGYREVYRYFIERALTLGAWVGSPATCLERFIEPRLQP